MARLLYLGYYLTNTDWKLFRKFFGHVLHLKDQSRLGLVADILSSSIRHNISLLDYFYFRFYELTAEERRSYAGTGYMYEFQKKMNPADSRSLLHDKRVFLEKYKSFIRHDHASLAEIEAFPAVGSRILDNSSGRVVLKDAEGQCGNGIVVMNAKELSANTLADQLRKTGNNLVEEYIVQHDRLQELAPAGLNTVRIVTQLLEDDSVVMVTARLRMTVDANVDNLAAGNIAAPIDLNTGKINGPSVYSDITKGIEDRHPTSGLVIEGFQIPYWPETLEMIQDAARAHGQNRSIGWDIAITNQGPELLEGNHDWCKLLWQLPAGKGLKNDIALFLT